MKSVMKHQFSQVPSAEIPRSHFNRSSGLKTAFDAGYLVPIFVDEALPGDTFNLRHTLFCRMQAPTVPIMDNLFLDTFYFFVPNRLIWTNWQRMMGERDPDPDSSIDFSIPEVTSDGTNGHLNESLYDYLTIPTKVPGLVHSNMWARAYNLVYNEWFRDQNLQDSVVVDKDDGPDTVTDYVLLKRGKRHDYFTSCLPWPQKGDAIEVSLGDTADVTIPASPGYFETWTYAGTDNIYKTDKSTPMGKIQVTDTGGGGASTVVTTGSTIGAGTTDALIRNRISKAVWDNTGVYADLSTAASVTINTLRQAFQLQKLIERDARGGTRYTEIVRSHFGVVSPDARLQRPEYLGGGSAPISVNPVIQTSQSDTTPQGTAAGFITGGQHGVGFTKSFTEHGVILGIACVRADLNYQQGLNRMFSRSTRYDFYWPALAMIGEQAVLNKEIYAVGTGGATDDNVFGYQERWAEYRYKPSVITGKMRSNDATSLDIWHLAQDFSSLPALNAAFIVESPPLDRVLAVTDEPEVILDGYFNLQCARPMPVYSVPGLIDHF